MLQPNTSLPTYITRQAQIAIHQRRLNSLTSMAFYQTFVGWITPPPAHIVAEMRRQLNIYKFLSCPKCKTEMECERHFSELNPQMSEMCFNVILICCCSLSLRVISTIARIESTGYSAWPSPRRLMRRPCSRGSVDSDARLVAARRTDRQTHTDADDCNTFTLVSVAKVMHCIQCSLVVFCHCRQNLFICQMYSWHYTHL